jgi:hypothetical protein
MSNCSHHKALATPSFPKKGQPVNSNPSTIRDAAPDADLKFSPPAAAGARLAQAGENHSTHTPIHRLSAFAGFYRDVFLPEHSHPVNVALHVLGTVAALAMLPVVVLAGWPWLALLFPVVHGAPGLLGHRFLERNLAVGDVRLNRTDFSPLWFIAANHRMTWELLTRGFYWRA